MTLFGDYVMLEELTAEQRSKGGIFIAVGERGEYEGQDNPRFGRVIGYGPGGWDLSGTQWINPESRVSAGDIVLLSKTGDYSYTWNGQKRLITKTAGIIGKLSKEEADGLGFTCAG